jgi:O-antigen/teichoic acid export membrane protein
MCTYLLTPDEFGMYLTVMALVSFILAFIAMGMPATISIWISKAIANNKVDNVHKIISSSFQITSISVIVFSSLVYMFSTSITTYVLKDPKMLGLLKVSILYLMIAPFKSIFNGVFSGYQLRKYESFSVFIQNIATILIIFITYSFFREYSPLISTIIGLFLSLLFSYYVFTNKLLIDNSKIISSQFHLKLLKTMFLFMIPIGVAEFVEIMMTTIDIMSIKIICNSYDQVSVYSIGKLVATIVSIIPLSFSSAFLPYLSSQRAMGNKINSNDYFEITLFLGIPILSMICFFSKDLLLLLFPSLYSSASNATIVLGFGSFFYVIYIICWTLIVTKEGGNMLIYALIPSVIINIMFNLFLIPILGILGAAIGTASSYLFLTILMLTKLRKNNELPSVELSLKILKMILLCFPMIVNIIYDHSLMISSTILIICIWIYLFGYLITEPNSIISKKVKYIYKNYCNYSVYTKQHQ